MVATGAGSLSYTSSLLQQVEPQFTYFFVAFFYVYAMHLLQPFYRQGLQTERSGPDHVLRAPPGVSSESPGSLSAFMALSLGAYLGPPCPFSLSW